MNADLRLAATALLDLARARGLKIATAESCTGGLVAGALTEIAGSSDVVDRGFVTYSNEAKQQMLGVPADTIRTHGAVSRVTAEAMARGALGKAAADIVVAGRYAFPRWTACDYRHRRPRRRQPRQAGWPGAFCRRLAQRRACSQGDTLRRYRPRRSAAVIGFAGAGAAQGAGGRTNLG